MSYQVLARKWRPKNFTEVTGQEHVLRALINALTNNRLHHAYLFTGTRGIGKTTIARILAKCLNCETGITATPCGACEICTEIDSGRFLDLIEVDAASRTKVEDTRDLLENVQYAPAKGRFKIYLIDEVHMLSGHSFNALLKTLEEPPDHVKFLFATTDPQKLPVTILSRCLQFNLKALPPELIQKHLQHLLTEEKIIYDDASLLKLALAAQGSVRDALSLLDQAIAYGNGKVEYQAISSMLGTIEHHHILDLLTALSNNDANAILAIIATLTEIAADFNNVVNELLDILHQITLAQLAPNCEPASWYNAEQIRELAAKFNPEEIQLYYQIVLIGKRDLPLAANHKNGFEMLMLRMLTFRPNSLLDLNSKAAASAPIDANPKTKPTATTTAPAIKNENINKSPATPATSSQTQQNQAAAITKKTSNSASVSDNNLDILSQLKVNGPTLALIRHSKIASIIDDRIEIAVESAQAPFINKKQEERLTLAFSEYFQKPMRVELTIAKNIETIAAKEQQLNTEQQTSAEQVLNNDQNLKQILDKFNAVIIQEK